MRRFGLYAVLTALTLVALAIVAVSYVANNFKVVTAHRGRGEDVAIETPAGRIDIRAHKNLDPATLGVPIYPDAKRSGNGGGASFEWTSSDGSRDTAMAVAGGEYVTSDSAEKVRAWYREHLPNWVVVTDRHDENAHFELNEGGYKRIIAIREKGDGTHIAVATAGEPASN